MKTEFTLLSASDITDIALKYFSSLNWRVRRVHNVAAYRGRAHHVKSGWPDIQGYSDQAIQVLCEVKKIGDTLKKDQKNLLEDCARRGGLCFTATQNKVTGKFELTQYVK